MPTYNFKDRELTAKIVYYGPGMCGKTTNLQVVHEKMKDEMRGKLVSIATESDRTIYFDLLPLNLGKIAGLTFTVRAFTVPGQIYYSETRRLVLQGADGVVFVADSGKDKLSENIESLRDLKKNLQANNLDYDKIPLVLQWNKRDLPEVLPTAALERALNDRSAKSMEAIATEEKGVLETLRLITVEVFNSLKSDLKSGNIPSSEPAKPTKKEKPSAPPPISSPPREAGRKKASRAAPPPMQGSSAALDDLDADDPEALKDKIAFAEFQNIAVLHHKLTERVALLEKEVFRLRRDLKQVVASKRSAKKKSDN